MIPITRERRILKSDIFRSDNPDAALVLEEWNSNIFALSEKPTI